MPAAELPAGRLVARAALTALLAGLLAGPATAAAAEPAGAGTPWQVVAEHLVLGPAPGGGLDVLELVRLAWPAPASAPGPRPSQPASTLVVPLPGGYQDLQVLGGLQGPHRLLGGRQLAGVPAPPQEGSVSSVALRFRLPASRLPSSWVLARPYPLPEGMVILLHPAVALEVAGAVPAGQLEVEGVAYRAFVGRPAGGSGPVLRPEGRARPWAAAFALPMAAALAVGWSLSRRRARSRPPASARPAEEDRRVRQLLARILELEAEHAAGYLDPATFRRLRQQAVERLAGRLTGPAAGGDAG